MNVKLSSTKTGLAVGAVLLGAAVLAYLLVLAPLRGQSGELQDQIDAARAQLAVADAARARARQAPTPVDDGLALAKAMPENPDVAGLLLDLSRVARDTGVEFDSVTALQETPESGYEALPFTVVMRGDFYALNDFLFRLRHLVAFRGRQVEAKGRLVVVDGVDFVEGIRRFPELQATLGLKAFRYGSSGASPSATPAPAAAAPAPQGAAS